MAHTRYFVVANCWLVLAACGGEASVSAEDDSGSLPVRMVGDEVMVACGGSDGWPPSIMATGIPNVLSDAEVSGTFQAMLDDPELRPELELSLFRDGVDVDWRVLRDGGDSLTLGLGNWTDQGPGDADAYYLLLDQQGDRWVSSGWGQCNLAPVVQAGVEWAEVTAVRGGETHSVVVEVTERQCASGRDPDPFLREPVVVETAEAVTLYWTTTPVTGGADCQGNPSVERTVELKTPLGARQILDGSTYPPRPVGGR